MVEVLKQETRKANKEHCCDYCGSRIQKGEKYAWAKLKCDGELYVWKNHFKCEELAHYLDMYVKCDNCLSGDEFQDCLIQYLQERMDNFQQYEEEDHPGSEMVDKAFDLMATDPRFEIRFSE